MYCSVGIRDNKLGCLTFGLTDIIILHILDIQKNLYFFVILFAFNKIMAL